MDETLRPDDELQLVGTVKNLIFQNQENGYTVLRLDVGGDEPITVVGCLPFAAPGEGLTVDGVWERHPSHGEQFKASSARRSLPVGEKHIYEYLPALSRASALPRRPCWLQPSAPKRWMCSPTIRSVYPRSRASANEKPGRSARPSAARPACGC